MRLAYVLSAFLGPLTCSAVTGGIKPRLILEIHFKRKKRGRVYARVISSEIQMILKSNDIFFKFLI